MITAVTAFGVYLLKATLFSGILYAYYHFALRDKQTFGWNRFYLLASALLAVVVPFLNIPLHLETGARQTPALVQVLGVVPGTADNMADYAGQATHMHTPSFPWALLVMIAYAAAAAALLMLFGIQVWRLSRLRRHASLRQLDDIHLIGTDAPGTPFSFFHWIFWDNQLPLDTDEGKRIFLHELAHVNGKHSVDKVVLQVLCAALFPVIPLYLIRRELQLVHEYQADYEATGRKDIDAYASYLVKHAMNAPAYDLSNAFHQHPLLRRIAMMNRAGALQGNASTWRRWMALPLLLCGFGLFAFTVRRTFVMLAAPRTLTVVIDAGHGGKDPGAQAGGKIEKDIDLDIARAVERLSPGYNVRILLSREVDTLVPIRGRVQFSDDHQADLFVSLHTNVTTGFPAGQNGQLTAANGKPYGIEAYVSGRNRFYDSSVVLGSVLLHRLREAYPSERVLREQSRGITVLAAPDCPSVLIECGFLDQPADAQFISQAANQEKVAREILLALSDYAAGAGVKDISVAHRH